MNEHIEYEDIKDRLVQYHGLMDFETFPKVFPEIFFYGADQANDDERKIISSSFAIINTGVIIQATSYKNCSPFQSTDESIMLPSANGQYVQVDGTLMEEIYRYKDFETVTEEDLEALA